MILTNNAYAKINLFLAVKERREDGFHNLSSVMQSVSLCDRIAISFEEGEPGIRITSKDVALPEGDDNLIQKAVRVFYETTGLTMPSIDVAIDKKIPLASGLAGGSSDAACVLRLLNQYHENPITASKILKIAAEIGSDVPFCFYGGTALCESKGEKITHLSEMPACTILLVKGPESKTTEGAYKKLDAAYSDSFPDKKKELDAFLEALNSQKLDRISAGLYNVFEDVMLDSFASTREIFRVLHDFGQTGSRMSGSGPTVFSLFEDEKKAGILRSILSAFGFETFLCHPVTREDVL
ncbi:MAG: 4-(cytidine 5'-diphospho)-2-C-methyl-D-erythritol kinase [Clostridia bacterium]|nr:4-(cytidine 5'-diphospho)-2-C-methyl-D-erythritol kinase [Clostridia bacterium]